MGNSLNKYTMPICSFKRYCYVRRRRVSQEHVLKGDKDQKVATSSEARKFCRKKRKGLTSIAKPKNFKRCGSWRLKNVDIGSYKKLIPLCKYSILCYRNNYKFEIQETRNGSKKDALHSKKQAIAYCKKNKPSKKNIIFVSSDPQLSHYNGTKFRAKECRSWRLDKEDIEMNRIPKEKKPVKKSGWSFRKWWNKNVSTSGCGTKF